MRRSGEEGHALFFPFFASLFTARLHHLWAWNRLRTGSSRVRESTHRKWPRSRVPETSTFLMRIHFIQFLGYGMCISILSLKVLRMLCLSRYKSQNGQPNRSFSRTWSVALQIPRNKRRFLREKIFQSPQDFFGFARMAVVSLFYTLIWPPWSNAKTIL